jgi:hypothetical protein
VTELLAWIAREPNPMLFNWLGMAYGVLGDVEAVRETVRENYRKNPKYLFARLNHAELCLRDGDLAGAREALGTRSTFAPSWAAEGGCTCPRSQGTSMPSASTTSRLEISRLRTARTICWPRLLPTKA